MNHHATPDFWACYRSLPEEARKLADQAYKRLKQDPQYPSLHFKKVGPFWSARVSGSYRALAVEGAEASAFDQLWREKTHRRYQAHLSVNSAANKRLSFFATEDTEITEKQTSTRMCLLFSSVFSVISVAEFEP